MENRYARTVAGQRRFLVLMVLPVLAAGLVSCSSGPGDPSAVCEQTVVDVLAAEKNLYDTHPLWDVAVPGVDASDEEFAAYEALQADEEAQWTAIYAPVYANCESPADWWAAANKYPGIAGLTGTDYLSPEDLQHWCTGSETQPACVGVEEWIASNPG